MNRYEASNGVIVHLDDRGDMDITNESRVALCGGRVVDALREFFRAEEDERIGRWRFPVDPDFVVYAPRPGFRPVDSTEPCDLFIINENWGAGLAYLDAEYSSYDEEDRPFADAGRAYFEAHPEPKPWHDAKEGEVWVIEVDGETKALLVDPEQFTDGNEGIDFDHKGITAGRRIYPESTDA